MPGCPAKIQIIVGNHFRKPPENGFRKKNFPSLKGVKLQPPG